MSAVVHIGYHKTGSTSLQRIFFPSLQDCLFLTHGGRGARSVFRSLADNLMLADDDEFLEETSRTFFHEQQQRAPKVLLISHENLSGQVFEGSFNRKRNAERLQRVLPDARILIVVRSQGPWLRSLYSQHVRHGGFDTFTDFILHPRPDGDRIDPDHIRYDQLVRDYMSRFGEEAVKVLTMEQLEQDPAAFAKELTGFIGVPSSREGAKAIGHQGQALSRPSRTFLRRFNRLFWKTRLNRDPALFAYRRAIDVSTFLHEQVDPRLFRSSSRALPGREEALLDRLASEYGESNRRLGELTGLPLESLGYPVAP